MKSNKCPLVVILDVNCTWCSGGLCSCPVVITQGGDCPGADMIYPF